jgi:hypothetical protein
MDVVLEPRESIGECLHLLVTLAEEMQDEAQSRSASYSRQRCHPVHRLL